MPRLIADFNAKARKVVRTVSPAAWERLKAHSWLGNIRELRNVIERCVLFADGTELPLQWLQLQPEPSTPGQVTTAASNLSTQDVPCVQIPLDGTLSLDDMDRIFICAALEINRYNVTAAARMLNSTRDTLRYRIQKYAINLANDD